MKKINRKLKIVGTSITVLIVLGIGVFIFLGGEENESTHRRPNISNGFHLISISDFVHDNDRWYIRVRNELEEEAWGEGLHSGIGYVVKQDSRLSDSSLLLDPDVHISVYHAFLDNSEVLSLEAFIERFESGTLYGENEYGDVGWPYEVEMRDGEVQKITQLYIE